MEYMVVGSYRHESATRSRGPRRTRTSWWTPPGGAVARALRSLGPPYRMDPQIGFESVTGTSRYLTAVWTGSPFDHRVLRPVARSRTTASPVRATPAGGRSCPACSAWTATAEDVIVTKLRWAKEAGRGKDRDDVRNVLGFRQGELDLPYIERWAAEHGTLDLLRQIAATVPPMDDLDPPLD